MLRLTKRSSLKLKCELTRAILASKRTGDRITQQIGLHQGSSPIISIETTILSFNLLGSE
jgi:hypothetical protein